MPKDDQKKSIPDLGRKVDFLEGLLGYAFCKSRFADGTIARTLKVTPAHWSRQKAGAPISSNELDRLLALFELQDVGVKVSVFELPFPEFEDKMLHVVQVRRPESLSVTVRRRRLGDKHAVHAGISLELLKVEDRGGHGYGPSSHPTGKLLPIGRKAKLRIEAPAKGHILVLNDHLPGIKMTCLAPSVLCESTAVTAGKVTLPTRDSMAKAVDVDGPPGWYRVFAIWTLTPITARWIDLKSLAEQPPRQISAPELHDIERELQARRLRDERYTIMVSDYQVVE